MVSHVYTWRCALFERGISRAPITCDALLLASRSQAMAGRMEAAEWLLGHGADALTSTSDGLTAERLAAISGHTKVQLIIMAAAAAIAAPSYAAASSASSGEAAPDRKQHSPARHNLRALSTGRLYRLRKSCCGSGAISSSVLQHRAHCMAAFAEEFRALACRLDACMRPCLWCACVFP